jgi:Polyketide cyclase / dehydrase and lipid transport
MPVIDDTVVIACPAEEVFDFPVHAANLPRWDSSMLECVQVGGGPVTAGTRYRGVSRILGRPRVRDAVACIADYGSFRIVTVTRVPQN